MSAILDLEYDHYYLYDELTDFIRACSHAAGDMMAVDSLCTTVEGREVWLATLTDPSTGPAEAKPAFYVQGHIHAHEPGGSVAALSWLRALIADPRGRELLTNTTCYVVPRVNPDGAEYAISTGGVVRSRLVPNATPGGLIPRDLNGDGVIAKMRWEDPNGPWVEDAEDPRIMVYRQPDSQGPFYMVYEEGIVPGYDGGEIGRGVTDYDFERNWPVQWDCKVDRADYPLQQPEVRAVADFLLAHHNIFAGMDFHCGNNTFMVLSRRAHPDMAKVDADLLMDVAKVGTQCTGFPAYTIDNYTDAGAPPIVLPGCSDLFAYYELGILWLCCELGNAFNSAGISIDEYFAASQPTRDTEFMRRILQFADRHTEWKIFAPWEQVDHPQLGKVEVGGLLRAATHHIYPPHLERISAGTTDFLFHEASLAPRLEFTTVSATQIAGGVWRIAAALRNSGRLATNIMASGIGSRTNESVRVKLEGAQIASGRARLEYQALARGQVESMEWVVTGEAGAAVTISASNPRTGTIMQTLILA